MFHNNTLHLFRENGIANCCLFTHLAEVKTHYKATVIANDAEVHGMASVVPSKLLKFNVCGHLWKMS